MSFLFGSPAKAPTASQQAEVGYYGEDTPFGSIEWLKNLNKGGAGYTKKVTLSPEELHRMGMSDAAREGLQEFAPLFSPEAPMANFFQNFNPYVNYGEGDVLDFNNSPTSGLMRFAQNMAPGLNMNYRMKNAMALKNALDYQPFMSSTIGTSGISGAQHPGTPAKPGLLDYIGQVSNLLKNNASIAASFMGGPP